MEDIYKIQLRKNAKKKSETAKAISDFFGCGRWIRTTDQPFAVPEICYSPFGEQISTAAAAYCSLPLPQAALANATSYSPFGLIKGLVFYRPYLQLIIVVI
ncbi:MAG: hypothetical protein IKB04_01110 [Clostridia bacterium]|nr:hypothetical protein [Clostridia bacterium]